MPRKRHHNENATLKATKRNRKSDFQEKVQGWINEDTSKFYSFYNEVLAFWHHKKPKQFRFFGLLHWTIKFSIIASAPVTMYYIYNRITFIQAATAVICLFVLHSASSAMDAWSKSKAGVSDLAEADMWVRIGDLINSVKSEATPANKRDESITASMGIIEGYARYITKPKGEIYRLVLHYFRVVAHETWRSGIGTPEIHGRLDADLTTLTMFSAIMRAAPALSRA